MRSQVFESLRKHDFRLILSVPVFAILITLSGCKKNPTEEAGLLGDWRARSGFDGKARQAAASFVLSTPDSKTLAYIGGGNDGDNNRLNDFWNYDNVRNTWTQVANFTGPARSSAVGFSVSNKGYVGTGIDANNARLNDFYQYDPATNKWTKVADYPGAPRYSAVAFAINGKGYVGTGYDRSNYYKDFFAYDPATNAWSIIASLSGNKREGAVAFVLNNLGYSLYLQGQDAAAIPILQRALAAATPGGPAPARRILALIADRLRSRAVASDAALARADIAIPAARVELAANGEQRLVFAAAVPAPELVARLGDVAALTMPARAWTAHDDAVVAASAVAPPPRVAAFAAPAAAPAAGVAEPATGSFVQAASRPAMPLAPLAPPRRRDEPLLRVVVIASSAPAGRMPVHPAPRRQRADALALLRDDRSLAWLALALALPVQLPVPAPLPQRRVPLPTRSPPAMLASFDSDDDELNAFAARMVTWRAAAWA